MDTRADHRVTVGIALSAIGLLGILVCVQPFTGDQALFAAGARQLQHGDVLYRDFWDVKQPGIYAFYLAGGVLVGYGEVAQHIFELLVLLAFCVKLVTTLAGRFVHQWVLALIPLFIVGTYYATAEPVQLGQVESLIGIPLFFTLSWAARAAEGEDRRRWLFLAGVAGGFVAVFKLVLLPIVGAIWLVVLVPSIRAAPGHRLRPVLGDGALLLSGLAIPVGITVAYLATYGQLETARWTFLDVTPATTGIAGRPISRLSVGLAKTAARWAVPLALAAYGMVRSFRTGWDRLQAGLATWIAIGIPVFLVQHWWIYQYAMFLVPVGIFAGFGLDALAGVWRNLGRRRLVVVMVGAIFLAPLVLRVAANARDVATHGFAVSTADRAALRADVEPNYLAADAWVRYLERPAALRGDVYVLGNPLHLYRSNRRQSVAINGWSPEQYSTEVWTRLADQIARAQPVELVVDRFSDQVMRKRAPAVRRLIHRLYRKVGESGADTWYRLRATQPDAAVRRKRSW